VVPFDFARNHRGCRFSLSAEDAARSWSRRRSRFRLALDVLTCVATLAAFAAAVRRA
jgi:hypothetical protein